MICRHCGVTRSNRPRGLCWSCYYKPGVRAKYPSTSKFARRGVGHEGETLPAPTSARPGSAEKVAILARRAQLGEALWHAADAPMDEESRLLGVA